MDERLYPDLKEFYDEGFVEYGSSLNRSFNTLEALLPTAPPLSEPDLDSYHDIDSYHDLDSYHELDVHVPLNITCPEEPEQDYDVADEPAPDYDVDKTPCNDLNFNRREEKLTKDKVVDFLRNASVGSQKDFNVWMNWRKAVNQQLLALILLRQGHRVQLTRAEMHRKPLSQQSAASIVREATGCSWLERRNVSGAEKTRLPGRPYIMYGIPRVRLVRSKVK